MARKKEPSFRLKEIIWDLAATTGAQNLTALQRDLDYRLEKLRKDEAENFSEDTPDIRTIRRIINLDIQRLPRDVVIAKLPPHVWRLRHDYEEIKRLAKEYPPTKTTLETDLSKLLREYAKQVAALAPVVENAALSITGLSMATRLNTLAQQVFTSFRCYEITGLDELSRVLSLCFGQRFDAWVGEMLKDIQSSLLRRKTIQDQILSSARGGYKFPGAIEIVDNNFPLAAYHFFVRGDEAWLEDNRFQVVNLGPVGQASRLLECPLRDSSVGLQRWDTRGFICPRHDVPLVEKGRTESLPQDFIYFSATEAELFQEPLIPVEDIALEHPAKAALSIRIPKMLPFSEVVIAVGEIASMPELRRFVQDFLRASPLGQEARQNEGALQTSYASLLKTLRSTPAINAGQSNEGESPA